MNTPTTTRKPTTAETLAAIHDAAEAAASRWLHSGEPLPVNSLQDGVESAFREWLNANTSELIQAIAEKAAQPPAAA